MHCSIEGAGKNMRPTRSPARMSPQKPETRGSVSCMELGIPRSLIVEEQGPIRRFENRPLTMCVHGGRLLNGKSV